LKVPPHLYAGLVMARRDKGELRVVGYKLAYLPAAILLFGVPCPKILNPVIADGHLVGAGKRNAPIYKLSFVQ
jgi:hypothetical protein